MTRTNRTKYKQWVTKHNSKGELRKGMSNRNCTNSRGELRKGMSNRNCTNSRGELRKGMSNRN